MLPKVPKRPEIQSNGEFASKRFALQRHQNSENERTIDNLQNERETLPFDSLVLDSHFQKTPK